MSGEHDLASRVMLSVLGPPMEHDDARLGRAVAGKVVLVTGASYGQGEATARLLAACGAIVLLTARTGERLDEIVSDIDEAGGDAYAYPVDMCELDAVEQMAARILRSHGAVDIVVHNAGKSLRRGIYRSARRRRDMDAMVGVNFLGPMRLTLALLPSMKANGGGQIINVATVGLRLISAAPRWSFYLACKAGFDIWIRSVGMELRGDGISVTSVYAGHIKSRMVATGWVRRTPGHTPAQAARVLAYAITRRPRVMAPRGSGAVRVLSIVAEGPFTWLFSLLDRRNGESAASEAAFARAMATQSQPQGEVVGDRGPEGEES